MSGAPSRACRLVLDLEADTPHDIASALYNMAAQIERDELTRGVSGGDTPRVRAGCSQWKGD